MKTDPLIEEYKAIAQRARDRFYKLFEEREKLTAQMDLALEDYHHAKQWAEQLEKS